MKLIAVLFLFCVGCAKTFSAPSSSRGSGAYSVGILRSQVSTPDQLAASMAKASFHFTSSAQCSVEAKLASMTPQDSQPSTRFPSPVYIELIYDFVVFAGGKICGSIPEGDCSPGKVIRYCESADEQAAGLAEAIEMNWSNNPAYVVRKLMTDPVGGVRVGN